jgi:hypothetical protein
MARPTIYNEEYITKTREYLNSCVDDIANKKVKLPSIEGLASFIGINRDTIYDWCKTNKEFSDIIDNLREKQAEKLLDNGLAGTYNSTIAKVLLTKHGYREGIDNDIDLGGKANPVLVKFVNGTSN